MPATERVSSRRDDTDEPMQVAADPTLDEPAQVEAWRLFSLIEAGWLYFRAEQIAGRADIDLHRAVDLLANGCDQRTAMRILL